MQFCYTLYIGELQARLGVKDVPQGHNLSHVLHIDVTADIQKGNTMIGLMISYWFTSMGAIKL